ncbi:MAG: YihY/virulence factor BrkB family protein [Caulobacteraceae bacterium]
MEALGWVMLAGALLTLRSDTRADPSKPAVRQPGLKGLLLSIWNGAPAAPALQAAAIGAREPGRGRSARRPGEIPARGWRDIVWRTWREFNQDRIPAVAGGVSFFGLLALFPALGAFVSLYGLFADVGAMRDQLNILAGVLPRDVLAFVADQMVRLAGAEGPKLGVAFAISLLVSLWSANAGMKALFDGLNIAYEETEKRGFIKLNLISFGFTFGALLFAVISFSAVIAAPVVLSLLRLNGALTVAVLRWPALLIATVAGLAVLYRFGPSREQARWRWLSWGSAASATLWLAVSILFSWYVGAYAHYDRIYGSLGAVVGFMTWSWLSTIVVLFGAELNAEIEHQTSIDTTTGRPVVMGLRGAKMADTLGESAGKAKSKRSEKAPDPRAIRAGAGRKTRNDAAGAPAPVAD